MKTKISKLAELIAKETFLKNEVYSIGEVQETINYILEYLDIIGADNLHLRNPLNLDENVFYFRKRDIPMMGNEIVTGEYLLFDYTGHNEDMFLRQLNSLNEIEDEITNGGGITNPFTTFQIAIINGMVRDYEIYFTNKLDSKEYKFIKDIHDALPEFKSIFDKSSVEQEREYDITNARIVWKA
ncbi:hypothetical protein MNQ98_09830 [Paenibacillus sp. N3/727]|uniref:hypothetical protein n=1 Tax=Paenibacillus sp. N3/727 TaxID=2925845 RepID=UPI001F530724|nr:hypothetical protein [Paenibacillus sp. N3/727]UNK20281.1 hypothetical protein MNQ98_09830 [Paenibacillus sp. N3/727]